MTGVKVGQRVLSARRLDNDIVELITVIRIKLNANSDIKIVPVRDRENNVPRQGVGGAY